LAAQYAEHVEDANGVQMNPIPEGRQPIRFSTSYSGSLGRNDYDSDELYRQGTFIGFETEQSKVPVDVYASAKPTHHRCSYQPATASAFDGRAAWIAAPDRPVPLLPLTGGNLEGAKLEAILAFPTQLRTAFNQFRVTATDIDNREVRVVQGTNPRQPPVNFYFDAESGLLVRVLRFGDTPVGRVPTQIDYSDYRDVNGIKLPFKWTTTWTNGQATTELTEIRLNTPIDAARFNRPALSAPPKQ
jgi:hypothetical protein